MELYLLVSITLEHGTLLEKSKENVKLEEREESFEMLSSGHGLDAAAKNSIAGMLNCTRTRELQTPAWSSSPKAPNLAEDYWELMTAWRKTLTFSSGCGHLHTAHTTGDDPTPICSCAALSKIIN